MTLYLLPRWVIWEYIRDDLAAFQSIHGNPWTSRVRYWVPIFSPSSCGPTSERAKYWSSGSTENRLGRDEKRAMSTEFGSRVPGQQQYFYRCEPNVFLDYSWKWSIKAHVHKNCDVNIINVQDSPLALLQHSSPHCKCFCKELK